MEEYKQLFKSINTDGDGKITLKEHCTALSKLPEMSEINVDYILMALTMFEKNDLTEIEDFDEIPEFLQDKRELFMSFFY